MKSLIDTPIDQSSGISPSGKRLRNFGTHFGRTCGYIRSGDIDRVVSQLVRTTQTSYVRDILENKVIKAVIVVITL